MYIWPLSSCGTHGHATCARCVYHTKPHAHKLAHPHTRTPAHTHTRTHAHTHTRTHAHTRNHGRRSSPLARCLLPPAPRPTVSKTLLPQCRCQCWGNVRGTTPSGPRSGRSPGKCHRPPPRAESCSAPGTAPPRTRTRWGQTAARWCRCQRRTWVGEGEGGWGGVERRRGGRRRKPHAG